jgi:hypothetical protein
MVLKYLKQTRLHYANGNNKLTISSIGGISETLKRKQQKFKKKKEKDRLHNQTSLY